MDTWSKTSVSLGYHSEYMHISSSTICHLAASISVLNYNFWVLFFWLFFSLENVTLLVLTSVQRSKPKTRDVIWRASLWLCITHRLVLFTCFTVAIFAISFWLQFVLWSFFFFLFFVDCSTIDLQSLMSLHDSSRRLDRDLFLFVSSLADLFVTSSDRVGSCSQHL